MSRSCGGNGGGRFVVGEDGFSPHDALAILREPDDVERSRSSFSALKMYKMLSKVLAGMVEDYRWVCPA